MVYLHKIKAIENWIRNLECGPVVLNSHLSWNWRVCSFDLKIEHTYTWTEENKAIIRKRSIKALTTLNLDITGFLKHENTYSWIKYTISDRGRTGSCTPPRVRFRGYILSQQWESISLKCSGESLKEVFCHFSFIFKS